jgi:general secretion pathway protein D
LNISPVAQRSLARVLCLLIAFILSGCAAQQAYENGKSLIANGQAEQGLTRLEDATRLDPNSVIYRSSYLQTREMLLNRYFAEADQALLKGDGTVAQASYRRVLAMEPLNARAMTGLDRIRQGEKHAQQLERAKEAQESGDLSLANTLLQKVLTEDPAHDGALQLKRALEDGNASASAHPGLAKIYQRPINLEVENATLRQVFALIARGSGLNFMFDREVRLDQTTTIFLKDSTVETALYYTLLTNQLEQQILDANTVLIYPNSPGKLKEYQELILRTFHLNHAEAKNVATYLRTFVKSREIGIDEKLNLVTIRDTPEAISIAEKLVALQDVPESEVMLEVEVLEVNRTRLLELGITWPDGVSLTPMASGSTLTLNDLLKNTNSRTLAATVSPLTAKAQQRDSDASILANPRIRVRNREKAKVMVGERVPNITTTATATGLVSESINYVDVGLKLEVEPTISAGDDVAIRVSLEVSSIVGQLSTKSGTAAYQLGTRNATTMLSLKDGETQILAGLINDEDRSNANKVPALGDIPLLGRLFGTGIDNKVRTEIVLSITPRLIRNIQRPQMGLAKFSSGTDSSFRVRPRVPATARADAAAAAPLPGAASMPASATAEAPEPEEPVSLQIKAPAEARVGDTVTLSLDLQTGATIASIPGQVRYDPTVLQLLSVTEGDALRQHEAQSRFYTINSNGGVRFTGERRSSKAPGLSGSLAVLTFQALKPADATQVSVESIVPLTAKGKTLPETPRASHSLRVQ